MSASKSPVAFALTVLVASALVAFSRAQVTTLHDVNSTGLNGGSLPSYRAAIADDGRCVAFFSQDGSLGNGPSSAFASVYVHDRQTGATELVSLAFDGGPPDQQSDDPELSSDGRFVAFESWAGNLVSADVNGKQDVFARDRVAGTTALASVSTSGVQGSWDSYDPDLSSNGRWVSFVSRAPEFVIGDLGNSEDVFVRDLQAGTTECASVDPSGIPATGFRSRISGDGRWVVFASAAATLVPADSNGTVDVFLRDRQSGTTARVSLDSGGTQAHGNCDWPSISADGQFASFQSFAPDLVPGDTNGQADIFLRDLVLGTTERISLSTSGGQANLGSGQSFIASGGRYVVFDSHADNLVGGDTNGFEDVFLRDRTLDTTERISLDPLGGQADFQSLVFGLTPDARYVVFNSGASNLVIGDWNSNWNAFVRDLQLVVAPIERYCTAKLNSAGCLPSIGANGAPLFTGFDSFFLIAFNVLAQKSGVYFWSLQPAAIPFGGGTLCAQPPLVRSPVLFSGGSGGPQSCTGAYSYQFRQSFMVQKGLQPGDTVYGQFWSRDPGFAPPNNVGLTNALTFTLAP